MSILVIGLGIVGALVLGGLELMFGLLGAAEYDCGSSCQERREQERADRRWITRGTHASLFSAAGGVVGVIMTSPRRRKRGADDRRRGPTRT
ncbi:MAG: hypothetical protein AB7P03_23285 [Kofleriaceae bacterium]